MTGQNQTGGGTQQTGASNYGGNSPGSMQGGQSPGSQGGTGGGSAGGHNISGSGPVNFSDMKLPNVNFPASKQEILQSLPSLPQAQRDQWQSTLQQLPDQNYETLSDLQQACQRSTQQQGTRQHA